MNNEITVTITAEEADIIMAALVNLPYKQVAQLVLKFDSQVRPQIKDKQNG